MSCRTQDQDSETRAGATENYVDSVSRPIEAALLDHMGMDRVRVLSHSQLEAVIENLVSRRLAEKVEAVEAKRIAERHESTRRFEEALRDVDELRSELRDLLEDWRRKCDSLREEETTRKRQLDNRLRSVGDGFERLEQSLLELESRPEAGVTGSFPSGASAVAELQPAAVHAVSSSAPRRHAETVALRSSDVLAASSVIDLEFPEVRSVAVPEEIPDDRNDDISCTIHVVGCRPASQREPHRP